MGRKARHCRTMMVGLGFLLLVLGIGPSPARAQGDDDVIRTREHHLPIAHAVGHYVKTHKFPLVIDAMVVAANAADAATTLSAAHRCPTCTDNAFGRNPSPLKTWGVLMGFSAGLIAFNHVAYHHYRNDGPEPNWVGQRFFVVMFSGPVAIHAVADVRNNLQVRTTPETAQAQARARLLRH